ncbi:MAG: type I-E CRISPR-associated protein Cas7/Cse4/CasC [Leptospiraceae bacterium]|nr:type I-E CRISPR-associated protein Cas7/Cse4/CasC [Leptospiraceae bacterium]
MNRFIQIHLLTSYPPSNLNRDDLGRPKTAIMGGANRLRISSQSLKRAWRTSDVFQEKLTDNIGKRTKEIPQKLIIDLFNNQLEPEQIKVWSNDMSFVFGDIDETDEEIKHSQLVHISPLEQKILKDYIMNIISIIKNGEKNDNIQEIIDLQKKRKEKNKADDKKKITNQIKKKLSEQLLAKTSACTDIAMFGRMLAGNQEYNVEAAVQVAHAITVHKVAVENDYFTALDDLNKLGAAHLGDTEFGAGLFYLYICIDKELLLENLNSDKELTKKTLSALMEACTTVSPTGKQNSFASRARAMFCLVEKGNQQPRSLHTAFLKPIEGKDVLSDSISNLKAMKENFTKVYGQCSESEHSFDVLKGEGSFANILSFVQED